MAVKLDIHEQREKRRRVLLRFLEEPVAGYEILEHDDVAASFEYDVEVSPTDGVSPPLVVDSP
jgi:hypothetical protein